MLLISFCTIGLVGHLNKGFPSRVSDEVNIALNAVMNKNTRLEGRGCHLSDEIPTQPQHLCGVNLKNGKADILLIGDSHLDAVGGQLLDRFEALGRSAYALSYSGCVPIGGLHMTGKDNSFRCTTYNEIMRSYASEYRVKTILLIARFPLYLYGNTYDNGEGGIERDGLFSVDLVAPSVESRSSNEGDRIERVLKRYRSDIEELTQKYNVIVFSPTPEVGWHVPSHYWKLSLNLNHSTVGNNIHISHDYDSYLERTKEFMEMLGSIKNDRLHIFPVHTLFCNEDNRRCMANFDKNLLYRDSDHLTPYAANLVADDFVEFFLNKLPSSE